MARITVEDCRRYVNNRFDLVLLAAQRAREIKRIGVSQTYDKDEKNAVVALREIADQVVSIGDLEDRMISSYIKGSVVVASTDEPIVKKKFSFSGNEGESELDLTASFFKGADMIIDDQIDEVEAKGSQYLDIEDAAAEEEAYAIKNKNFDEKFNDQ